MKGGSWTDGFEVTKMRYRVALARRLSMGDLGFRVVWDVE
jgi:formylglycine-generating enzyme required for sulfatase activity